MAATRQPLHLQPLLPALPDSGYINSTTGQKPLPVHAVAFGGMAKGNGSRQCHGVCVPPKEEFPWLLRPLACSLNRCEAPRHCELLLCHCRAQGNPCLDAEPLLRRTSSRAGTAAAACNHYQHYFEPSPSPTAAPSSLCPSPFPHCCNASPSCPPPLLSSSLLPLTSSLRFHVNRCRRL